VSFLLLHHSEDKERNMQKSPIQDSLSTPVLAAVRKEKGGLVLKGEERRLLGRKVHLESVGSFS